MEKSFKLKIVTPEEEFFSGDVVRLTCETTDGLRGILANHCAMVAVLIPTTTSFKNTQGKNYKANTARGVLKVRENNVTILCDSAEWLIQ